MIRTPTAVDFTHFFEFVDGSELTSESTLRFRTEGELRDSLERHGLIVDSIAPGWVEPAGEFVVEAHRR